MTAANLPIPADWAVQGGAVGLLALVVLMILTGRLVPVRHYTALARERDEWRFVALKAMGHTDALLPAAQITTEMVTSLADASTRRPTAPPGETR